MALKVGDKAPDFELTTKSAEGPKKIKLSGNFGKKNTVLLFFPMAFTGVCTKEMCEVSQGLNAYTSLNADVLGISGDNPFAQGAWAEKEKITVPLLSDYEHKVAQRLRHRLRQFPAAEESRHGRRPQALGVRRRQAGRRPLRRIQRRPRSIAELREDQGALAQLK